MVFGSVILLIVVALQGKVADVGMLSSEQWVWVIIPSLLLFGYVTTWYTALKYAPATLVSSLLVPAPFFTQLLTALFLTHTLTFNHLLGGVLFVAGVVGLMVRARSFLPRQVLRQATSPVHNP